MRPFLILEPKCREKAVPNITRRQMDKAGLGIGEKVRVHVDLFNVEELQTVTEKQKFG